MKLFSKLRYGTKRTVYFLGIRLYSYYKRPMHDDIIAIVHKLSLEDGIVQLPQALFYVPDYPLDLISRILVDNRTFYEQPLLESLSQYITPDSVIMDIGANIGNHSVYWGIVNRVQKVYSFEPVTYTYKKLLKNIELNHLEEKIKAYNIGFSDEKTSASINYFLPSNIGATSLKKDDNGSISLLSIDEWIENEEIKKIDFVKIDTEGAEKEVLQGASAMIDIFKPMIFIEIEQRNINFCTAFLAEKGYTLLKKYDAMNHLFKYKSS